MRKKIIIALAVIMTFALIVMLPSCKGAAVSEATSAETTTVEATTEVETEETSAETKAEEQVVIEFWQPHDMPITLDHYKKAIAEFEALNPNIKIEMTTIPWSDIFTKWMAAIEANDTPDVTVASTAYTLTLNNIGALLPVDYVIERMGGTEIFADSAKSLYEMSIIDGKLIAIPFIQNASLLWYNEQALKDAGLEVPKTWDELMNAAKVLTTKDHYGILVTGDHRSHTTLHCYYSFMLSNDTDIFDRKTGELIFNNPNNLEAIKFYTDLAKYSPPDSFSYQLPDAEAAMGTGKIDMFVYGSWLNQSLHDNSPETWKKFKVAGVPTNKGRGNLMGHANIAIFKNTEHPEEAAKWVEFLLTGDTYLRFVMYDPVTNIPCFKETLESDKFWNDPKVIENKDKIDVILKELPYGWMYGVPSPFAGAIEGNGTIGLAIEKVWADGKTPQVAMDETTEELKKIIGQ